MRKGNGRRRRNFNARSSVRPSLDFGKRAHRKGRMYFTGGYRA